MSLVSSFFLKLVWSLQALARRREGVSAVEFALLAPVMITVYLGSVELGEGLSIQFKTTLAARTVADLASQYITISSVTMSNILSAASTVVAPYNSANMAVTVSEIGIDASGIAKITWSCSLHGTPHSTGTTISLPSSFSSIKSVSLIWGEVTYPYLPQMGYVLTGTINVYESVFFYPRGSSSVALSSCP
jgi:Flp pilus assembly protein TadG